MLGEVRLMGFWKTFRKNLWLIGAFVGVLFLILGAISGQFSVYWRKAILICMECIGLG